jgi:DnaJ family protein C protein 11
VLTLAAYKSGFWTLGPWGRGMAQQLGRSDRSGLAVGVTTNNANGSAWTLETQVGVRDNHISADWGTKVLGGVKIKFGGSVGTETGISAFVDSERKVTNSVKAGLMVTCALGGGVTMKIKLVA